MERIRLSDFQLSALLSITDTRTIIDYLFWRLVHSMTKYLDDRYEDVRHVGWPLIALRPKNLIYFLRRDNVDYPMQLWGSNITLKRKVLTESFWRTMMTVLFLIQSKTCLWPLPNSHSIRSHYDAHDLSLTSSDLFRNWTASWPGNRCSRRGGRSARRSAPNLLPFRIQEGSWILGWKLLIWITNPRSREKTKVKRKKSVIDRLPYP